MTTPAYQIRWRENNREKYLSYMRDYQRKQRAADPEFHKKKKMKEVWS